MSETLSIFYQYSTQLRLVCLKSSKKQILWNGFAHVEKRYLKNFRISKTIQIVVKPTII